MRSVVFRHPHSEIGHSLLRESDNFGLLELDLVAPPPRFWDDAPYSAPSFLELGVDARRAMPIPSPTALLEELPRDDNWMAMTRRSLARLAAWFLVVEDPQGRLRAQAVTTLAHQASLVTHVLSEPRLGRVLIADEVGLGKTIEAGLIIRGLLASQPGLRVLYLAPARLVANVRREFDKLDLSFRQWVAGDARDATLRDQLVIASIHRAVHPAHYDALVQTPPWDVLVVDECHHLSDWEPGGGSPMKQYRLVQELVGRQPASGRLILMTGTPHQGHRHRFENLLALLRRPDETPEALRGRVIYRIKDDVRDWSNKPLFPSRLVNNPHVIDLGEAHRAWLAHIHDFYVPPQRPGDVVGRRRAAGWRCAQALQWATSSVHAGLGYLIRQAIRAGWTLDQAPLPQALAAIRPYRLGPDNEPIGELFRRIEKEVARQADANDIEDIEEAGENDDRWKPDDTLLAGLLAEGIRIIECSADLKWTLLNDRVLQHAGSEKVVLFAQPIETVTALARFLERTTGKTPALIIGNQGEAARQAEIEAFWRPDGPQYLVSSRAGGEGLNLQVARRLVHVDVPWNPMELEQRVGRVHRFGSRQRIIVDTVVAKDSREVDMYRVARTKLTDIASTLVPQDRFDALFARVMSLVPPEDLQLIMGERPLSPLTGDEEGRIADLIDEGFTAWREFHERFADQEIRALDPGQASWNDIAEFARAHLGAEPIDGFTWLQFDWHEGEIRDASVEATVFRLRDGKPYGCGDFGGMPITGPDGEPARLLGLNLPAVAAALRDAAFPALPSGAAQLRWAEDRPRPEGTGRQPFAAWVAARQSIDLSTRTELRCTLHAFVVHTDGTAQAVNGPAKGTLLRGLMTATVRREPDRTEELCVHLRTLEASWLLDLRQPSEEDRTNRIAHCVTPLLGAIVA